DPFVETLEPPVQRVRPIVDSQSVDLAVEFEHAAGDAVAVAADERCEVWVLAEIAVERVEPQEYVAELAALVGDFDRNQRSPVCSDAHRGARRILQAVELHALPRRGRAP